MSEHDIQQIDSAKLTRRYEPGQTVYLQGEACQGIYCIEAGSVAIRRTQADGNSMIMRTAYAGRTIGYADFFAGQPHSTSAYCLEAATICQVPSEVVQSHLARNSGLGLAFLAHSAQDLQEADSASVRQSLYSVRMRVAQLLVSLKDRHGAAEDNGSITVSMPMSWQEASELVGARPESVSRALQALSQKGILRSEGRKVHIEDLDLLLDEIDLES